LVLPSEYWPCTVKFCDSPTFRFGVSGEIERLTRMGVEVAVGVGVRVRVGVGAVDVGVGVGASTTVRIALPPDASELMPVPGSVTEIVELPMPTASTRPRLPSRFGGNATARLLEW
jgi:hypothetical protein